MLISGLRTIFQTAWVGLVASWTNASGWLVLALILTGLQATFPALQFWFTGRLIELTSSGIEGTLLPLIGVSVLVGLVYPLAQLSLAAAQRVGIRVRVAYRTELMSQAARLSPSELAKPETAINLEAADQAIGVIEDLGGKTLQLLGAIGACFFLTAALWSTDPLSGVLTAGALLPTIVAFSVVARREAEGWPAFAKHERRGRYLSELLLQQRSATEVSTLGGGALVSDLAKYEVSSSGRVLDRMIAFAMKMEAAAALLTAILFGMAVFRVVVVSDSAAGAAAAVIAVVVGLGSIRQLGYAAGSIISASPRLASFRHTVDRLSGREGLTGTVLDAPHDGCGVGLGVVRGNSAERLDLVDIEVSYRNGTLRAVDGVSMSVGTGDFIAIVGANGAGKTSLMNAIVGVRQISKGSILVNGENLAILDSAERGKWFGLLTQEFGRYELSVRQSLALGVCDRDPGAIGDAELWKALEFARLRSHVESMPEGLDSELGEQWGGESLSGGQWQRLALARLFLRDSPIWILDEPTSSLDAEVEQQIFDTLRDGARSRVTIVVSHRASTLSNLDSIFVMRDGRIVQQGPYKSLIEDTRGAFYELFAHQLHS